MLRDGKRRRSPCRMIAAKTPVVEDTTKESRGNASERDGRGRQEAARKEVV